MNLVDSSGWLEYFADGANAHYFSDAIEDTGQLIVSTINIYEVFKKILQQRDEASALQAIALMYQGTVVELNIEIAIEAAKTSHEIKLPIADSIIFTTARFHHAQLLTQDSDFEGLENVSYFAKRFKR